MTLNKNFILYFLILLSTSSCSHTKKPSAPVESSIPNFIQGMRQFTYDGTRAGEGYFSPDGKLMIFQSERENSNPFYQMYIKNLESGAAYRVSPGYGKTTCGWIAPDKSWITYSSTHLDPKSKDLQLAEFEVRKSGQKHRYSWDYDENFEIFSAKINGKNPINLTRTHGYDAESSISPNGRLIVFASNRTAYSTELTAQDKDLLAKDPAYFMEIYTMNSDGSNVKRLTESPGYDGGPFFSPDGSRIVWRKFSVDGMTAEIFTMNIDGSDIKQLTNLKAMSWAPFYHPSGDYIIFTSSVLGHQNFELYAVDTDGKRPPVRITYMDGFDGLPVFTPDGKKLTWNRKISSTESQIMIADWNDSFIRTELQLSPSLPVASQMDSKLSQADLKTILRYLSSAELKGRETGSSGELAAAQTIEKYFKDAGLSPYNGRDYIQKFNFLKEAVLGSQNTLTVIHSSQQSLELDKTWRPLAFSRTGETSSSPIVFAGYGLKAPSDSKMSAYDSYAGLDVKDKWVMVFRYIPEKIPADRRLYLQRYSKLEHKAIVARNLGARGIIFVSGPNSNAKNDLIPFKRITGSDMGISAISITDEMADQFFTIHQKSIKQIQNELDYEKPFTGFEIEKIKISAKIDIRIIPGEGHNVLGLIKAPGTQKTLIIGAHGDHLGNKANDNSLSTSHDLDTIHYGADDNASGVSATLELAHYFKKLAKERKLKQNILFAIWSGEELGNLGSSYFVRNLRKLNLKPNAYINMDMIGRWKTNPKAENPEPLLIQGVSSSHKWRELIEGLQLEFPVQLQNDPYLPTDSMALYMGKIPTINFFTGVHTDYHTPRDTEDKINYAGLLKITQTVSRLSEKIAFDNILLDYNDVPQTSTDNKRGFRIFLGTIPDYSQENTKGVKLSGVITGGPAEKAGIKSGDIIVEFSNKKIENIHDYVFTLESIRPNEPTNIVVLRNGQREEISIIPQAKE